VNTFHPLGVIQHLETASGYYYGRQPQKNRPDDANHIRFIIGRTSHMIRTEVDDIGNSSLKSITFVPSRSLASSNDCCVMIVFVPPVFTTADNALGTLRPCEFSALTINT